MLSVNRTPELKFHRAIFWLIFTLLVFSFLSYLWFSYQLLSYPFDWSEGEGDILFDAVRLARGEQIYTGLEDYPMSPAGYPPLYLLMQAPLFKIFGIGFLPGRLLSFIASLVIGLLIFLIVREETRNLFVSLIAGMSFFACKIIIRDLLIVRTDTIYVMFSLLAVYLVWKYNQRRWYLPLGILSLILAVFTKQFFPLYAVLTIFIYLFLEEKKVAWKALISFLSVGIVITIILSYLSNGRFLNSILPLGNPLDALFMGASKTESIPVRLNVSQLFRFSGGFTFLFAGQLFLGISYLGYAVKRKKEKIWLIYFLASLFPAILTLHIGSWIAYFWPLLTATCIIFGLGLHNFNNFSWSKTIPLASTVVSIVILILIVVHIMLRSNYGLFRGPTTVGFLNAQKISSYVKNTNGDVLTDRFLGFAILNEKDVFFEPSSAYGHWAKVADDIQKKRFSLIIARIEAKYPGEPTTPYLPFYSSQITNAIYNNYKLIDKLKKGFSRYTLGIFVPISK